MKITAIAISVPTSASRQWTGLRCSTVPSAEITASAARKMKVPSGMSTRSRCQQHDQRGNDHVGKPDRHQPLPSEAHQLVVAKARQRPAYQDLEPAEDDGFDHEGDDAEDRDQDLRQRQMSAAGKVKAVAIEPRHLPSAEKKYRN